MLGSLLAHCRGRRPRLVAAAATTTGDTGLLLRRTSTSTSSSSSSSSSSSPLAPPLPPKKQSGPDPWAWLEHPKEEVLTYLEAESLYTDKYLRSTHQLQHELYREMISRVGRESATLPEQYGPYLYYSRRKKGKNFPIYYRCNAHDRKKEAVVFDQNSLPDFYQHFQLKDYKVSPDHCRVAFTLCPPEESSWGTLYIQEVEVTRANPNPGSTRRWWTCEGGVWKRVCGFEWTRGGSILYTTPDKLGRPCQVRRSWLDKCKPGLMEGSPHEEVLFFEDNDRFFVSLSRSADHAFVMINSTSKTTSEVRVVEQGGEGGVTMVRKRDDGVQYFVDHGEGRFVMVVNSGPGGEYALATATAQAVMEEDVQDKMGGDLRSQGFWEEVTGGGGAALEDLDLFKHYCVLYERDTTKGAPQLRVLQIRNCENGSEGRGGSSESGASSPWLIDQHVPPLPPEASCAKLQPGLNHTFDTEWVRFSLTSPIIPDVTYDYHMGQKHLVEVAREKIQGRPVVRAEDYRCYTVSVPSAPGVSVPLTLAYHTSLLPRGGRQGRGPPVLLMGYGAYGVSLDISYRPEYLSLMRRGWVLAFAHVRGGGELGRRWHHAGRGKDKPNSFHDYLACAHWLCEGGYTTPGRLVGVGGSAGALLVAVAVMRQPELFGAMVLKVPFLDIANTMRDPTRPLTLHEYDEWGDATDPHVMALLRSYSPYDTLRDSPPGQGRPLPPTLMLAALMDDRVGYWEAAKWMAKARDVLGQEGSSRLLLRVEGDQGHFGPTSYTGILEEAAFEQAFMMKALGEEEAQEGIGKGSGANQAYRQGRRTPSRYMVPPPALSLDLLRLRVGRGRAREGCGGRHYE